VIILVRRPILAIRAGPSSFQGPRVSTATGTHMWVDDSALYFFVFDCDAYIAADPAT